MIDKSFLEARIAESRAQEQHFLAQANACHGAAAAYEDIIKQLESIEPEKE